MQFPSFIMTSPSGGIQPMPIQRRLIDLSPVIEALKAPKATKGGKTSSDDPKLMESTKGNMRANAAALDNAYAVIASKEKEFGPGTPLLLADKSYQKAVSDVATYSGANAIRMGNRQTEIVNAFRDHIKSNKLGNSFNTTEVFRRGKVSTYSDQLIEDENSLSSGYIGEKMEGQNWYDQSITRFADEPDSQDFETYLNTTWGQGGKKSAKGIRDAYSKVVDGVEVLASGSWQQGNNLDALSHFSKIISNEFGGFTNGGQAIMQQLLQKTSGGLAPYSGKRLVNVDGKDVEEEYDFNILDANGNFDWGHYKLGADGKPIIKDGKGIWVEGGGSKAFKQSIADAINSATGMRVVSNTGETETVKAMPDSLGRGVVTTLESMNNAVVTKATIFEGYGNDGFGLNSVNNAIYDVALGVMGMEDNPYGRMAFTQAFSTYDSRDDTAKPMNSANLKELFGKYEIDVDDNSAEKGIATKMFVDRMMNKMESNGIIKKQINDEGETFYNFSKDYKNGNELIADLEKKGIEYKEGINVQGEDIESEGIMKALAENLLNSTSNNFVSSGEKVLTSQVGVFNGTSQFSRLAYKFLFPKGIGDGGIEFRKTYVGTHVMVNGYYHNSTDNLFEGARLYNESNQEGANSLHTAPAGTFENQGYRFTPSKDITLTSNNGKPVTYSKGETVLITARDRGMLEAMDQFVAGSSQDDINEMFGGNLQFGYWGDNGEHAAPIISNDPNFDPASSEEQYKWRNAAFVNKVNPTGQDLLEGGNHIYMTQKLEWKNEDVAKLDGKTVYMPTYMAYNSDDVKEDSENFYEKSTHYHEVESERYSDENIDDDVSSIERYNIFNRQAKGLINSANKIYSDIKKGKSKSNIISMIANEIKKDVGSGFSNERIEATSEYVYNMISKSEMSSKDFSQAIDNKYKNRGYGVELTEKDRNKRGSRGPLTSKQYSQGMGIKSKAPTILELIKFSQSDNDKFDEGLQKAYRYINPDGKSIPINRGSSKYTPVKIPAGTFGGKNNAAWKGVSDHIPRDVMRALNLSLRKDGGDYYWGMNVSNDITFDLASGIKGKSAKAESAFISGFQKTAKGLQSFDQKKAKVNSLGTLLNNLY